MSELPEVETSEDEDNAAMMAGFNNEASTTKPEPVKEEPVIEEVVEEPEAPKIKSITESEYQSLLDAAAQVATMKATIDKQFGTAFGKLGGIERTIQQIQSTPAGQMAEVSLEDMAELKEYGEDLPTALAKSLNKALAKVKVTQAAPAMDEGRIDALVQERLAPALVQHEQQMEVKAVRRAHADYKDVFAEEGFNAWRTKQTEARQEQLGGWDSDVIIQAITDYKDSKKPKPKAEAKADPKANARKELLAASTAPRGAPAIVKGALTDDEQMLAGYNNR